jgi:esterase/lipase superfamily enzyme
MLGTFRRFSDIFSERFVAASLAAAACILWLTAAAPARAGVVGTQLAKLTAADAAASDEFGRSVAISGNTAIVGAYRDDDAGTDSGSAYLFDVATGAQLAKLTDADAAGVDFFGASVAISDNTAIVGARFDDDVGSDSGSAYLFTVPEPSTFSLATTALAAVAAVRPRRRRPR